MKVLLDMHGWRKFEHIDPDLFDKGIVKVVIRRPELKTLAEYTSSINEDVAFITVTFKKTNFTTPSGIFLFEVIDEE